jgi:glycerol-3-phosphate dehydrogenase (NAD(P)+)
VKLGVIGGGAWGTALAQVVSAGGEETLLWAREPEVVEGINARRENSAFLPGVSLNNAIRATDKLADLDSCESLLVVTPAQHMRTTLQQVATAGKALVLCAKGIEERTGDLLHRVAQDVCPGASIVVLSGPTFAHEVAQGLPTAVTLAAENLALAERLRARIARPTFRIYVSDDLAGAEIVGAVKNVLAIACGVVEGKGLGQNARAALIGRGFAEMTRFGLAMGARRETLAGPHYRYDQGFAILLVALE